MRWTEQEWEDYADGLRQARIRKDDDSEVPDAGPESKLQAKCLTYCRERGYLVWHDWSRKRNQSGWPDIICFLPKSRLVLIELKSGNAKLRTEQQALRRQLLYLGFEVHVVRSYRKFLQIMKGG